MGSNCSRSTASKTLTKLGRVMSIPFVTTALVSIAPTRFKLGSVPGFLHLVAFRAITGAGFLGLGGVGLLTLRAPSDRRPWARGIVTTVMFSAGIAHLGVLLTRNRAGADINWKKSPDSLVVIAVNTLQGAANAQQLSELIATNEADFVSLPETSPILAQETADLLAARGMDFQVFSTPEDDHPNRATSMLISTGLGVYRQVSAPRLLLGAVRAEPEGHSGPVLVAVHPGAPVRSVGFRNWAVYVRTAVDQGLANPNVIVAGDFNATVDHGPFADLGECVDAAAQAGRGAEGTWPANIPPFLAAPIDHVLIGRDHFRAVASWTFRIGGSDHRALVVGLIRLRDGD